MNISTHEKKQVSSILSKIRKMKKIDLHLHLNGLFNSKLVKKIVREEQICIPEGFDINKDLNILTPKENLISYFKPWEILKLMPRNKNNLEKLIKESFKSLAKDNVEYVEIRSTIIYLSKIQSKSNEEILSLLLEKLNLASKLYKVDFSLIFTISRNDTSIENLKGLIDTYKNIGKPKKIVGLDLAGDENYSIRKELGTEFKKIKDKYDFKITIHAGETGNINNIYEAVNDFGADRIGHGIAIGKCPKAIEFLAKRNICVEVCPISNKLTNSVKNNEKHPVNLFIKNNVPFVICSDNPGIHNKTLSDDYFEFYKQTKRFDIINNMYSVQKKYSFI